MFRRDAFPDGDDVLGSMNDYYLQMSGGRLGPCHRHQRTDMAAGSCLGHAGEHKAVLSGAASRREPLFGDAKGGTAGRA